MENKTNNTSNSQIQCNTGTGIINIFVCAKIVTQLEMVTVFVNYEKKPQTQLQEHFLHSFIVCKC